MAGPPPIQHRPNSPLPAINPLRKGRGLMTAYGLLSLYALVPPLGLPLPSPLMARRVELLTVCSAIPGIRRHHAATRRMRRASRLWTTPAPTLRSRHAPPRGAIVTANKRRGTEAAQFPYRQVLRCPVARRPYAPLTQDSALHPSHRRMRNAAD